MAGSCRHLGLCYAPWHKCRRALQLCLNAHCSGKWYILLHNLIILCLFIINITNYDSIYYYEQYRTTPWCKTGCETVRPNPWKKLLDFTLLILRTSSLVFGWSPPQHIILNSDFFKLAEERGGDWEGGRGRRRRVRRRRRRGRRRRSCTGCTFVKI